MTPQLWGLGERARQARSDRELGFLLVNETWALSAYRQAALWLQDEGVWALSGVVQMDANVPYVQWLQSVAQHCATHRTGPIEAFTASDLPAELAAQWAQWWPAHALWVAGQGGRVQGGSLWVRDEPWTEAERAQMQAWSGVWWHAFAALHVPRWLGWRRWRRWAAQVLAIAPERPWWRQPRLVLAAIVLAVLCWPVRLTVLAPGELVPSQPIVVRAPLDGIIDVFHVRPNQQVQAEQALFGFDELVLRARLDVAAQALATAETDYRQTTQMALNDPKSKVQLGLLLGRVEEKRAEIQSLEEQLTRATVHAPQAGVVLMDDPSEWIGKPVATGERILRLAALDDVEVEAWVPLADAIGFVEGSEVNLYLSASPLSPVSARVRYMAHDAVLRADGGYAYRVRAVLAAPTAHRVGLKGTAKLHGPWVPMVYWALRRPLAALRAHVGW